LVVVFDAVKERVGVRVVELVRVGTAEAVVLRVAEVVVVAPFFFHCSGRGG